MNKPNEAIPETPVAWRGSHPLYHDDLRAHLAGLLRVEHIGVFLGAGASVVAGGRTVAQLFKALTEAGVIGKLEKSNFPHTAASVEAVLDDLQIAHKDAMRRGDPADDIVDLATSVRRAFVRAAILDANFWTDASSIVGASALTWHRQLLVKLSGARQPGQVGPWVFTPNYDLAVEWAGEAAGLHILTGFHGLHRRTFSSHVFDLAHRNVLARGEARFGTYDIYLAKLHGSLCWQEQDGEVVELPAHAVWPSLHNFLGGAPDTKWPQLLVYPGTAKYDQTTGYIMGEMFRRFTEFVSRPQTALIVSGYGFGDAHINRVLRAGLQNPTFHLVVYLPEVKTNAGQPDLTAASDWLRKIGALELPQLTIVGGDSRAYFNALVADLPDPAIYDDRAAALRSRLREFKAGTTDERS